MLLFFSFLFLPLLHAFSTFIPKYCPRICCLEWCKNHLLLHILCLWSDPKSLSCCSQNYLMHFYKASSFSFSCKRCASHLSGLHPSERSPLYFSFKTLPVWNFYKVRIVQGRGMQWVILLAACVAWLPKFWKSFFCGLIAHMCSLWSGVSRGLCKVVSIQVGHNSLEQKGQMMQQECWVDLVTAAETIQPQQKKSWVKNDLSLSQCPAAFVKIDGWGLW